MKLLTLFQYRHRLIVANKRFFGLNNQLKNNISSNNVRKELPKSADVVIIGGGIAGCSTLYQLTKRNVNAIILERSKLTSGTTWHSAGMSRGLQPCDVQIQLLNRIEPTVRELKDKTGLDPGWINNGGLFIAHDEEREKDYLRQVTFAKYFNIKCEMLDPNEVMKITPLLDPTSYRSAMYCPEDGVMDPAMLCNALKKAATANGGQIFEDSPVIHLQTLETKTGRRSITGVVTPNGIVQTKCIVNCTGAWSPSLAHMLDLEIPLVPMKHSYVVSNSIKAARGMPCVRDLNASIYFRIQGESICLGGYENNPEILKEVPSDFQFSLYDLDWDTFNEHVKGAVRICPEFGKAGIKSTVCGPESFTPDHNPIMGEDPRVNGLFHSCGYNSAGMMLSAGCSEQIAEWVVNGRPELPMYTLDIRRFTPKMIRNKQWKIEKAHEGYTKNYSTKYSLDESLAGRDLVRSPFHNELVAKGAFMEQKLGWERARYFRKDGSIIIPEAYRWYGAYGNDTVKSSYEKELDKDCTFSYPPSQKLVRDEALACRNNAVLFDLSYYCKLYLTGEDSQKAVDWIFSGKTDVGFNKTVYTCGLNEKGGVETDLTVTQLPDLVLSRGHKKESGFYIVAGGATAYHTLTHINSHLEKSDFNVKLEDITEDLGVLSIQGPNSKKLLQTIIDDGDSFTLPIYQAKKITIDGLECLIMRISFVGELGYEIHIPKVHCLPIYQTIVEKGHTFQLKHAGFRALYSLSCEKGYHLWNLDLRADDNPLEANLGFTCRKKGDYIGRKAIDRIRESGGVRRKIAYFTLKCDQPLWGGLETIWRDGVLVGYLRRGDYAFSLDQDIGVGYIHHPNKEIITDDYLLSGNYQIEVNGQKYKANIHKKSPFDPENKKMLNEN